ncbi:MAG: N-acetyltransferase [Planctomycetes bacterium]|nr:N-acetyltransferase [Planctomycetota bacterium]MBI3846532.1 N-acetyltransferase [Planctomycetota bacterium]
MSAVIRLAVESDAAELLAIYAPIVRETAVSFELEPPSLDEYRRRIVAALEHAPWLVYESDAVLLGYAHAGPFRPRPAYRSTVEVTVYVHSEARRRGVGRALYASLLECSCVLGYRAAIAAIALPNDASVRLHESFGFRAVGVLHRVGFKLGRWHDVGWWERGIGPLTADAPRTKTIADVRDTREWRDAVDRGLEP